MRIPLPSFLKWLIPLLLLIGVVWAVRFSMERAKQAPQPSSSHLAVGVVLSPIDFGVDSLGHFSGLQVDLMEALLPDTLVEWHPFATKKEALKALQEGVIALYATSSPIGEVGELSYATATRPLFVSGYALVHANDSIDKEGWTSYFHRLNRVPISIPDKADNVRQMLEHLRDISYPMIEIIEVPDATDEMLCLAVSKGELPFTVCDRNMARAIGDRVGGIYVEADIALDYHQCWYVGHHHHQLLDLLNAHIQQFASTSQWRQLLQRHTLN